MQTCSNCNATTNDSAVNCPKCNAKMSERSVNAVSLRKFIENDRVRAIRITVANDSCPVCFESRGTFDKHAVPQLPHQGCSHQHGCRCMYEPILSEVYP